MFAEFAASLPKSLTGLTPLGICFKELLISFKFMFTLLVAAENFSELLVASFRLDPTFLLALLSSLNLAASSWLTLPSFCNSATVSTMG